MNLFNNQPKASVPQKAVGVSELNRDINELFDDCFGSIWVHGELADIKQSAKGHIYGTLKDENSLIKIVIFRSQIRRLLFEIEEGQKVILHGKLSVYAARGEYQIIVDDLRPKGMGDLRLAFERLKEKLKSEGFFDEERKKKLPYFPTKIGLITSAKGAVLHDMQSVFSRRSPWLKLVLYPVNVQGAEAKKDIQLALEFFNQKQNCDLIILARGGGSLEDLWTFNTEEIVYAISKSRLPVISAIGHQTDFSLSDFVADLRAPTPTAAAELAAPAKEDLLFQLDQLKNRMSQKISFQATQMSERVNQLKKRLRHPKERLTEQERELKALFLRLNLALEQKITVANHKVQAASHKINQFLFMLEAKEQKLLSLSNQLKALSPKRPFKKGFSLVYGPKGKLIKESQHLKKGDLIQITLAKGGLRANVKDLNS